MTDFSPTPVDLGGLSGLQFEIDGVSLAVVVDTVGSSVTSYSINELGVATQTATLGAADGLGMILPENLNVVPIDGKMFGLVSSSGTSSISVFEISSTGDLAASDQVIDGQGTRFASVSALEVTETDGRAFVTAAGDDDGLTVMELLPDGRLMHHATFADSEEVPLRDISSLDVTVEADGLHISAVTGTGTTELTFDLGRAGQVITGSADSDVLTGTDLDDVFVSGEGQDSMTGGLGADSFIFGADSDGGRVEDFNATEDRLDLSGWSRLGHVSQLDFVQNGDRLDIGFEGRSVTLLSHDGKGLKAADVVDQITVNPSHSMNDDGAAGRSDVEHRYGTEEDDVIFGDSGQDIFHADGGSDHFVGGGDFDVVTYESASSGIRADLKNFARSKGDIADDTFHSIEGVAGTDFKDVLKSGNGGDWLDGGGGNDKLVGRGGNDTLLGGEGDDKIVGGGGDDSLEGGDGRDKLIGNGGNDDMDGGADADKLKGNGGNDTLRGGDGDDRIIGGGGDDKLYGDGDNDRLTGGGGADEFYFIAGDDRITDFNADADALFISQSLLDDPFMSAADILATYGQDMGGSVRLDFGPDDEGQSATITLENVGSLDDLTDSLFLY